MKQIRTAIVELYKAGKKTSEIIEDLKAQKVNRRLVQRTIKRFIETGDINDRPRSGRPKTKVVEKNIKIVRSRVRRNPKRSIRKMATDLNMSERSMRRIVKDVLHLKPYKMQEVQLLNTTAKRNRLQRCRALKKRFANGRHSNIVFSDEKLFTIEQSFNRQNDRILATGLSEMVENARHVTRTQKPASVMIWAGITAEGRTPLCFIDQGVKVDSKVYLEHVLQGVLQPWATNHFDETPWCFQQDSAPAHKAKIVQAFCKDNFPEFISIEEWPSSSPDLNPMDFSIWGILEKNVNATQHSNIENLKCALKKAWEEIPQEQLRASVDEFYNRLTRCIRAKGGHFE
jgi:inhibitor of nuclear factor kappa-B kinase subunit alpha